MNHCKTIPEQITLQAKHSRFGHCQLLQFDQFISNARSPWRIFRIQNKCLPLFKISHVVVYPTDVIPINLVFKTKLKGMLTSLAWCWAAHSYGNSRCTPTPPLLLLMDVSLGSTYVLYITHLCQL